jgi:hypothetical protein
MKRATLLSKGTRVRSQKVEVGSEADSVDGFTKRILLSLVVDVMELRKTTERMQVQVFTLAKEHKISTLVD